MGSQISRLALGKIGSSVALSAAPAASAAAKGLLSVAVPSEGFYYTPAANLTSTAAFETCGAYGSPATPTTSTCYGPGGYIKDIWAAAEYRSGIQGLLEDNWIDEIGRAHV